MKYRRLGRSGLVVSEICLGTMTFGSMADEAAGIACMDKAFDAGVDFLDVAEVYPVPPRAEWAGRTEEIVGKWLGGKPRDAVFIATKVAGPGRGWFQAPVRHGKTGLDAHNIERAVEDSLRRLGTDYIDLYQTHWPDPGLPYEETLEGLARVVAAGKVRAIGCSNETAYGLTKSLWAADRNGLPRYETIQNNFSLLNWRFEDELSKVCRAEGVSLLPYSPIAAGVLSGKYQGGVWPEGARFSRYSAENPRTKAMTERFVNEASLAATERYLKLAADSGMSPVTLAIAWTLSKDYVGSTIIGVTSPEQLDPHLAAAEVKLSPDVLAEAKRISREIRYPLG
ncbi:MAG: aldo/keto reductase [Myxococcales bacterium]|nr:aldo/keto reductase [Myxococcales bacterium]